MILTVTYESTTIDFNANGYKVLDGFSPETGNNLDEPVVDQFDVWITGTKAEVRARIEAVELALWRAAEYKDDPTKKVYVNFEMDDTATAWRSRALSGKVLHGKNLDHYYRQGRAKITVVVERDPLWEGAETALPLTNVNGTDNTSGLNVFKLDTRTGSAPTQVCNYVEVDGADVSGNLPGFVKVEVTTFLDTNAMPPSGGNYVFYKKFFIGQGVYADFANLDTTLVSAGTLTWTETTEKELTTAALTSANLDAAKGGWFRLLLVLTAAPSLTNLYLRAKIKVSGASYSTTVWQGALTFNDGELIQDLGVVRIPPYLIGQTSLYPMTLCLNALSATIGSKSIELQYIELRPVDGWRRLDLFGGYYKIGAGDDSRPIMTLNEYDQVSYVNHKLYSGSEVEGKFGTVTAVGKPLMVYPGKTQRFYFSWTDDGVIPYSLVKMWYRPRKTSI